MDIFENNYDYSWVRKRKRIDDSVPPPIKATKYSNERLENINESIGLYMADKVPNVNHKPQELKEIDLLKIIAQKK